MNHQVIAQVTPFVYSEVQTFLNMQKKKWRSFIVILDEIEDLII